MESRIIVFAASAPCIGDSARTRPHGVAGGWMSRGDEVRTPLRLERDQIPGPAELIRELLSIETAVVGPGVRLPERYAMGLGERRHGYGECVGRRDKAVGLKRTSVGDSRRLRARSMHDGPDRTLCDEWTIPTAVATASAGRRHDLTSRRMLRKSPANRLILRGFRTDSGGERGIRTPDRRLTYTRFPGVRLKPLIHLSGRPRV